MNELQLRWRTTRVDLGSGGDVDTLDYVIDAQSLPEWFRWVEDEDLVSRLRGKISPFGRCFDASFVREAFREMTRVGAIPVRVALYVCPCGDHGCGTVSVLVRRANDTVVWSAFEVAGRPLANMPAFEFASAGYKTAFGMAAALTTR